MHINYALNNYTQRGFFFTSSNQEELVIQLSHSFHFSLLSLLFPLSHSHHKHWSLSHPSALSFLCSEQMENDLWITAATKII